MYKCSYKWMYFDIHRNRTRKKILTVQKKNRVWSALAHEIVGAYRNSSLPNLFGDLDNWGNRKITGTAFHLLRKWQSPFANWKQPRERRRIKFTVIAPVIWRRRSLNNSRAKMDSRSTHSCPHSSRMPVIKRLFLFLLRSPGCWTSQTTKNEYFCSSVDSVAKWTVVRFTKSVETNTTRKLKIAERIYEPHGRGRVFLLDIVKDILLLSVNEFELVGKRFNDKSEDIVVQWPESLLGCGVAR